jgi:hypothetical protein
MFGSDSKVSFHSTGQCQWSRTDSSVKRTPGMRNSERHIARWNINQPEGHQALLVFQIDIPVTELREQPPLIDKKKVFWFSGAPSDLTIRFLFYITPKATTDPVNGGKYASQSRHVVSLRLRNRRWFVVFVETVSLPEADLRKARKALRAESVARGFSVQPGYRGCLFALPSGGSDARVLELCLLDGPS